MDEYAATRHSYDRAVSTREININSLRLIGTIMGSYMDETLPMRLHCECGRVGCDVIINMTLEQRRSTRDNFPQGFVLLREHLETQRDKVMQTAANFMVVRKEPAPP